LVFFLRVDKFLFLATRTIKLLSVLGSIVQTINGTNLVISELSNNINLLQCATAQKEEYNFNKSLALFVHSIFSSKRCALPQQVPANQQNVSLRVARKLILSPTHAVTNYLRGTNLTGFPLYQTCWLNNVQFTVHDPTRSTQNSDSCLLFKSGHDEMNAGFLMAIVFDIKEDVRFIIHTVSIDRQDSMKWNKSIFLNPFTFWGKLTDPPNLLTISRRDIVVKLAYKEEAICFAFFQYPNTVEST
jgi:hypothetical protein